MKYEARFAVLECRLCTLSPVAGYNPRPSTDQPLRRLSRRLSIISKFSLPKSSHLKILERANGIQACLVEGIDRVWHGEDINLEPDFTMTRRYYV